MVKSLLVLFVVIGWGTSVTHAEEAPASATLDAESLLKRDPQVDDYVDAPRCLRTHQIRGSEVIDDKHVVFKTGRTEYYLVQMDRRCPGLERGNPIMYEGTAGRLCIHDGIRGTYRNGIGSYQPGMRCAIPGFQRMSKEQLVLLKDTLKAERRARRQKKS